MLFFSCLEYYPSTFTLWRCTLLFHELSELEVEPVPVEEVQEDQEKLEHEKDAAQLWETRVEGDWGVRIIDQLLLEFERYRGLII